MMRLSSSAVLARSRTLMPATRLVEHQQLRVLDQQHADLEPLLLAVTEQVGAGVEAVLQEDHLRRLLDALLHRGVALEGQRSRTRVRPRGKEISRFSNTREVFVDRRRLELAADAGLHDLVLLQLRQLRAAELDRA